MSKKSKKKNKKESESASVLEAPTAAVPAKTELAKIKLRKKDYEKELAKLHVELVKMQEWIKDEGIKIVVIFEGRDAAGKGGTIKRITETMNPRICRVVALGTPTEREKTQWYFQRYVAHLPAAGEIVLFDRSWYNRAGVERVMGYCTDQEHTEFMHSCPQFERMLVRSGVILLKYWFSVNDKEQEKRFLDRLNDPTRHWKLSPMDLESLSRWIEYSKAKDEMFSYTDTKENPWYVVNADNKRASRLNMIRHLLSMIPYKEIRRPKVELPPRNKRGHGYIRPPMTQQNFVPEHYEIIKKKKK
jgi:polyphosphate kinase 2